MEKDDRKELINLLESISCLCAEGPEFMSKLELIESIQRDAFLALDILKEREK